MQGNKGKKPTHLDQQLQRAASKPLDIIIYVLHPRSDLLTIYWIQPLILKSLMFSWPVSALSTHQFFVPLFQSQPSIKSPEPGEGQSAPGTGRSHPATGKASAQVLYVQIKGQKGQATEGQHKALLETRGDTARLIYSVCIPLSTPQPLPTSELSCPPLPHRFVLPPPSFRHRHHCPPLGSYLAPPSLPSCLYLSWPLSFLSAHACKLEEREQ